LRKGKEYQFEYSPEYQGLSVSLTMPLDQKVYHFDQFPPFFEGLLPEGGMLFALLKKAKIDESDYFEQLIRVGQDMVGSVTVEKAS
jgi:serine/threonine-protein kinase HipA